MKLIIIFFLLASNIAFSQNKLYFLENVKDSQRVEIKTIKSLYFVNDILPVFDSSMWHDYSEVEFLQGLYEFELLDNKMSLHIEDVNLYGFGKFYDENILRLVYRLKSIKGDYWQDNYEYTVNYITGITLKNRMKPYFKTGAYLSLVNLLIIAPLVAYDFRNKIMNNTRYANFAKYSIVSLAVFVPINLLLKDKTYRIKTFYDDADAWRIVKK